MIMTDIFVQSSNWIPSYQSTLTRKGKKGGIEERGKSRRVVNLKRRATFKLFMYKATQLVERKIAPAKREYTTPFPSSVYRKDS